jgi:hypothetical protein
MGLANWLKKHEDHIESKTWEYFFSNDHSIEELEQVANDSQKE